MIIRKGVTGFAEVPIEDRNYRPALIQIPTNHLNDFVLYLPIVAVGIQGSS